MDYVVFRKITKSVFTFLKKPIVFFPVLTVSLYASGLISHQSYLSNLNVDESLFRLSFERTVYDGFIILYIALMYILVVFVVLTILLLVLEGLTRVVIHELKLKGYFSYKVGKPKKIPKFPSFYFLKLYTQAYFLMIFYIVILIVILYSNSQGMKEANDLKKEAETSNQLLSLTHIKSGGKSKCINGYMKIICNQNQCAFYYKKNTYIFNLSNIREISTKNCS